jgi:maleamate amidohydrolase
VFVQKVPALRLLEEGSELGRLMPQVRPEDGEPVLVKQHASAFFGTDLADRLAALEVDTVVIVGVSTSGCVRATAVDAVAHDLVPLVVRDGVADRTPDVHEASLFDLQAKYAEVVELRTVLSYLDGLSGPAAHP